MATGPVVWVNREVGMENWWWEGKIFPAAESGGRYLFGKAVRSTSAQPVLSCLTPVCSYATRERGMRYCVSSIGVPGHCQPYIAGLMQYAMVFTRVVTKAAHIHLRRHNKSNIYLSSNREGGFGQRTIHLYSHRNGFFPGYCKLH